MQYNYLIFSRLNVLRSKQKKKKRKKESHPTDPDVLRHVTPTCALGVKHYKNTLVMRVHAGCIIPRAIF